MDKSMEEPGSTGSIKPYFEISTSHQFTAWMAEHRVTIAFTTYQAGKVFFSGLDPNGSLAVFNRIFERLIAGVPGTWAKMKATANSV